VDFQQGQDFTNGNRSTRRATDGFRAAAAVTYALGQLVKQADLSLQISSDGATVIPTVAALGEKCVAVVSEDWNGFSPGIGASPTLLSGGTVATGALNLRGTQDLKATVYGYHPSVLIDQANAGAATITHNALLASSQTSAGKAQGVASAATLVGGVIGTAMLPAAGIGSSLAQGALAAATQTVTIAAVPAAGDVITVNLQVPFSGSPANIVNPGVVVVQPIVTVLTAASAASVTTAAAAVVANINAATAPATSGLVPTFYSALNVAGVITITVLSAQFFVTFVNSNFQFFYITTSGTVGNSLTITSSAAGGSTAVAGGGTFAGGTGYVGTIPAMIKLLGC
jgi:hypothetical protein